ncbi:MAG: hypothetical protein Q3962_06945 [Corynebacterium sp.]|nr:hypothetical protein [Corynebacterium sp.]
MPGSVGGFGVVGAWILLLYISEPHISTASFLRSISDHRKTPTAQVRVCHECENYRGGCQIES